MAIARKDSRGRALRKGEVQRKDGRYCYTYTDPLGRRKFVYAPDLVTLREKEKRLMKDQLDGLDLYAAGHATVNDTFDRYISTKYDLRIPFSIKTFFCDGVPSSSTFIGPH